MCRPPPPTFQRLIELCLGNLNQECLLIYLDDFIIFWATFEEHLQRVEKVLGQLEEHGLKQNEQQCHLL